VSSIESTRTERRTQQLRSAQSTPINTDRKRKRRKPVFNRAAKRRHEIEAHARHVGAADTDDLSRWLIAWIWHNSQSTDQVWAVVECAVRMGGKLSCAEAAEIIEEASITRRHMSADRLARWLGVTSFYGKRARASMSFDLVKAVRVDGKPRNKFVLGLGSQKDGVTGRIAAHLLLIAISRMKRHGLNETQRRLLLSEMIRKGARRPTITEVEGWLPDQVWMRANWTPLVDELTAWLRSV
jgi:hypothetical protein